MSFLLRVTNGDGEEKWFAENGWVKHRALADEIPSESEAEQLRDVTELAIPASGTAEVVPVE